MTRLALLLIAAALPGLSQTTVGSRLLDWKGAPIAGAEVHLRNKSLTTRSDAQGRFSFNLDPVRVKPPAPALRGPVLERGSGWFDFLGRRQRGTAASMPLPAMLAKTSAGAADLDLLIKARGFDDREILVKEPARLDTLIRLGGRGISIKSPGAAVSCSLGHTVRFYAVHRDSTRRMRIELDSTGDGKWFLPASPACFVETRFQDTCRFVVPARLAIPKAGGKADTLRPPGHQLRYRVVEIGSDSIQDTSPHPITVLKKIEPEIHLAFEAEVSIKDTFTVKAALRDPLGETLQMYWRMGGARFPNVAGTGTFTAPAQADTLEADFVAIRPDGSEYVKTAVVKVVLDPPVIQPQPRKRVPINYPITLRVEAQNRFGSIRYYEWDPGRTGKWQRTETNFLELPAKTEITLNYKVVVRAVDDDGLTGLDTLTLDFINPILPIDGASITDLVPLSRSRTLFAGRNQEKVVVGTTDSLGVLQVWYEWSRYQEITPPHDRPVRILLNREGGATVLTRLDGAAGQSELRLLRINLAGDSLGENAIATGPYAEPRHFIQAASGDYTIAYVESWQAGWVARTDSRGAVRWKKKYAFFQSINHLQPLANGNHLLAGEGMPEITGGVWHARGALAEIDANGDTVWTRTYPMRGHNFLRAFPVTGGYRIHSRKGSDGIDGAWTGFKGIWSLRVDAKGAILDSLPHDYPEPVRVLEAIPTRDGGTLVMGLVDFNDGPVMRHYLYVKLNASGGLVWKQRHDDYSISRLCALHEATDGGFMAGGWGLPDFSTPSPVLVPLKSDGAPR